MSQSGHPISPPPVPSSPPSTGVRRHHTISSSRTRVSSRSTISEEQELQLGYEDEVVDEDWVGGVGAVGEKSSLHRQSSLPTRYHRGFHGQASRQAGNLTPRQVNSLSVIAGQEGDEEDWEREMRGLTGRDDEEENAVTAEHPQHQQVIDAHSQASSGSPLSPHFQPPHVPSPPPAASSVRRHQSLTYGASGGVRQMASSGLRRAGTLQAQMKHHNVNNDDNSPSPPNADEGHDEDGLGEAYEEEEYFAQSPPPTQQQYPTSPIRSPWNTPGEWRTPSVSGMTSTSTVDDVSRALSALEIASQSGVGYIVNNQTGGNFQLAQPGQPPRFSAMQQQQQQPQSMHRHQSSTDSTRKLQLVTEFGDGARTPVSQAGHPPASASAYVPPAGHSAPQDIQRHHHRGSSTSSDFDDRAIIVSNTTWDQKERLLGGRPSNSNLNYGYSHGPQQGRAAGVPTVPSIPAQYLNQQGGQAPRMGATSSYGQGHNTDNQAQHSHNLSSNPQGILTAPVDVPSLITQKGYNPTNFDTRPVFARYFVIKSYTEDDVHKSLKYEIWSSTDPGNKRLDKAFKECAGRGPIYLFFSVNASGHFCGMAEMLTPVDYTRSSTVWASDKWKGVFKVRWIFVRDIPNASLRHIRLNNTQERKPVTNSRDTQELLPDAGQEMLRIFHTHPARTSLLQDFAFYEVQAIQKIQMQNQPSSPQPSAASISPPPQHVAPVTTAQNLFALQNSNLLAYAAQMQQLSPLMQMQMQMNMNMNPQFALPQAQAMHQSVMRHSTPGSPGSNMHSLGGQNFMGMGNTPQF